MSPILARYGPYFLYAYTVALGLGVALALGLTAVLARRRGATGWLDGVLLAAFAAVAAGRVAFVALNRAYFLENPAEVWQVWRGGLTYHAALIAGLLAYWLWLRATGRLSGRYAALVAPGLALIVAAGWAACWFEGCAYGRVAPPGMLSARLPDDYGVYALRYQTQALGALSALAIAAAALWLAWRGRDAATFWLTLAALSLAHGLLTLLRGDPAPLVAGLRLDTVVDATLVVVALVGLLMARLAPGLSKGRAE